MSEQNALPKLRCSDCGEGNPLRFTRNRRRRTGYSAYCRGCTALRSCAQRGHRLSRQRRCVCGAWIVVDPAWRGTEGAWFCSGACRERTIAPLLAAVRGLRLLG